MSAVYLHNSIYTRDVAQGRATIPLHSRNQSTISSVTVQTNSTLHSHPGTEPLLQAPSSSRDTYFEDSERNSKIDVISPATQWTSPTSLTEETTFVDHEKTKPWKPARQRAPRKLKWTKFCLEAVIGGWAIYNAVRYFLAFTAFEENSGEWFALGMGVAASLSFAFLVCSIALSLVGPELLRHGIPHRLISIVYWTLIYTSLVFLLAPAVTNFALVFVWRDTTDVQLRVKYRCYVDIDVVWSRREKLCKGQASTWGFWVVLSSLRLVITGLFIFAYQFVLVKLRRMMPSHQQNLRSKHRHKPSDAIPYHSSFADPATGRPNPVASSSNSQVYLDAQSSTPSILSSRTGPAPRGLRLVRSQSSGLSVGGQTSSSHQGQSVHRNTPLSVVPEQEGDLGGFSDRFSSLVSQIHQETDEALEFAQSDADQMSARSQRTVESTRILSTSPDGPWSSDEEEDGNALGQGTGARQSTELSEEEDEEGDLDDFYGPRSIPPSVGYNEFGQPYPAEQQIAMMNGYIRRMPTIESMGSREMASSIAASSLMAREGDNNRHSFQTNMSYSRPPTRNTLISMLSQDGTAPSEPSSRHNSLTVQVERLAALGFLTSNVTAGSAASSASAPGNNANGSIGNNGSLTNVWPSAAQDISEIGELIDTVQSVKKVPPPDSPSHLNLPAVDGEYLDSTAASRSTNTSYQTASMGSSRVALLPARSPSSPTFPTPTPNPDTKRSAGDALQSGPSFFQF